MAANAQIQHGPEPSWLPTFHEWIAQPCPEGEWVYRGQPERFESVVPSLLRDPTKRFRQTELFDFNQVIAERLFSTSPVFGNARLYEHLITDDEGREHERLAYSVLGGPPASDPRLSFREVIRALGQHYGFPTLFVDLSLHPLVAALFATHEFSRDGCHVSDESSIVYRWPARRLSPARLRIATSRAGAADDSINVIDISHINPHLRRPRNQFALLATPVDDPKPFFQPFQSPLDALALTDLRQLPSCEEFRLPARAGEALTGLEGVSIAALFPDAIDPGFSYLAFIALLSLIVHEPDVTTGKQAEKLREGFEDGINAARAVLNQECARLVSGCGAVVSRDLPNLTDARAMLSLRTDMARAAAELMAGRKLRRQTAKLMRQRDAEMRQEVERRARAMEDAVRSVVPDRDPVDFDPPAYVSSSAGTDWLLPEIDRRGRIIESVIARSELVPSFALDDAELYRTLSEVLPSTEEYEIAARTQLAAQRTWLERGGRTLDGVTPGGGPIRQRSA